MRLFLLTVLLGFFTSLGSIYAQGVGDTPSGDESGYVLNNPSPNPFKESTNIAFTLKKGGLVAIKVYNLLGNEVDVVLHEQKTAGTYTIVFEGKSLPRGIYFLRFSFNGHTTARKIVLTD